MSDKTDGGPAFGRCYVSNGHGGSEGGMTLRDWFAGQALVGLVEMVSTGAGATGLMHAADQCQKSVTEMVAWTAYDIADAMLKERAK